MDRECSMNGEKRNAYGTLVGKAEIKRLQGRSRHMWVDNTEMDLRVVGWGGADWIDLAEDKDQWMAPVDAVVNLRIA
jgi:hypothetical protein